MSAASRISYRFGPLERRGILGPVRAGQAATLGAGIAIAVVAVDHAPTGAGVLGALIALAIATALAAAPVGGRTPEEWTPVVCAFAVRRLRRRDRFRSPIPAAGVRWRPGRTTPDSAVGAPPPGLGDLELRAISYGGRTLGALSERRGRRMTAMLACRVVAFPLLDPSAQERRLAQWGTVLSSAADTPIRRLQWIERTGPAQGDELARWLHTARDPAVPLRGTAMVESYLELIESTTRVTQEHEILIAVQVDTARLRERGDAALERALLEETERLARGLADAEIAVLGALSPSQLARYLRTAFDPYARPELAALEAVDPERDGLDAVHAWPLGIAESWEHVRCDGALHATFWIGGWPRVEVSPMFMDAILGRAAAVRTVAVTFEPVSAARSTREVEAAVTRDRADSELRRRFGQSETARQRRAQEAALRREAEIAAGHAEVRLAGFITVTGRDDDDLRRACADVADAAARARLELHRMYGQQGESFTFTLPLARGLR